MIYTITFNPSLDVSGEVDELVLDEKNYVHHESVLAGGNGINAGIIAHRLLSKVKLTGFLGGSNGKRLAGFLTKDKIPHHFITVQDQTRMNVTISNKSDHRQTRLSFLGPVIRSAEKKLLLNYLKRIKRDDIIMMGGSLPPGVDPAYIRAIIHKSRRNKAICIVDMPGHYLKSIIHLRPDFIKPNLTEFQDMVGKKVNSIKEVLPLATKLLDLVPCICISSIEGGAIILNKSEAWFGKLPKVKIHSSVGAGDSMVGAIASLWNINPQIGVEELLRLGLAASCASLTQKGLKLGSRKSILKFKSKIIMKKLSVSGR